MEALSLITLKSRTKVRVVVQQSVSSFAATEAYELLNSGLGLTAALA